MSRLGNLPVSVPAGVSVSVDGGELVVKGGRGELRQKTVAEIKFQLTDAQVSVQRLSETKQARALHGLYRQLLANMVTGVSAGCHKKLEISGVGYRAELKGRSLFFSLGYSMQIEYLLPEGIDCKLESPTSLTISGMDKQKVGQVASEIRGLRPPEPYKGKGVRYAGEYVRIKAGKSGA